MCKLFSFFGMLLRLFRPLNYCVEPCTQPVQKPLFLLSLLTLFCLPPTVSPANQIFFLFFFFWKQHCGHNKFLSSHVKWPFKVVFMTVVNLFIPARSAEQSVSAYGLFGELFCRTSAVLRKVSEVKANLTICSLREFI